MIDRNEERWQGEEDGRGRRRGVGPYGLEYATWLRENKFASKVDKAVRERRVWLAAAAELRETEEVKRTGPASPAPCLQGLRWGETRRIQEARTMQGSTQEDR